MNSMIKTLLIISVTFCSTALFAKSTSDQKTPENEVAIVISNQLSNKADIAIQIDEKIVASKKEMKAGDSHTFFVPKQKYASVIFDDGHGIKECQILLTTSPRIGKVPDIEVKLNEKGEPACAMIFAGNQ